MRLSTLALFVTLSASAIAAPLLSYGKYKDYAQYDGPYLTYHPSLWGSSKAPVKEVTRGVEGQRYMYDSSLGEKNTLGAEGDGN